MSHVLAWLLTGTLIAPLVAAAQTKSKPVVGFLVSFSQAEFANRLPGLRQGLRDLGYVEGKNIVIEYRYANGRYDQLPVLAAELVRMKVDVLLVQGAPAARALKNATRDIPIVIGNAADPVGIGLVASLARPGGNITGLSDFNVEVVTKRLELLKEVAPSATRVAVLSNPQNPSNPLQVKHLREVAPKRALTILSFETTTPAEVEQAFVRMAKQADVLLVIGDPMLQSNQTRVIELATKARLPAIYTDVHAVEEGGMMSYTVNFAELYRRAATYIDKILKGAKPADLPMEQPTKFELAINLAAAKQIGVTIPRPLLQRADRVVP